MCNPVQTNTATEAPPKLMILINQNTDKSDKTEPLNIKQLLQKALMVSENYSYYCEMQHDSMWIETKIKVLTSLYKILLQE